MASRKRRTELLTLALLAASSAVAFAHHDEGHGITGFRADFLADISRVEKKVVSLAEAVPADKYDWAPTPEVRTVAASYVHMAQSSHRLLTALGVEAPEGIADMEREITAKDAVVNALEASFEAVRETVMNMSDEALDEKVQLFGREWSKRQVLMQLAGHCHEHLGQQIAYARSVGVVPPWSRPREAAGEG